MEKRDEAGLKEQVAVSGILNNQRPGFALLVAVHTETPGDPEVAIMEMTMVLVNLHGKRKSSKRHEGNRGREKGNSNN